MSEEIQINCPKCGSDRLATSEKLLGACGIRGFYIEAGELRHEDDGNGTEVAWDTCETDATKPYVCRCCGGEFTSADLVATLPAELRAQITAEPSAPAPDRLAVLRGILADLAKHAGMIERKQREAGPIEPEEWHALRVLVREAEILANGAQSVAPELLDEAALCAELESYCKAQGLPYSSADELAASDDVSAEQREWLRKFCDRWERWEDQQRAARAAVDAVADAEGWGIFNGSDLQRDDEANTFASDDDARAYVERMAAAGSPVHAAALRKLASGAAMRDPSEIISADELLDYQRTRDAEQAGFSRGFRASAQSMDSAEAWDQARQFDKLSPPTV